MANYGTQILVDPVTGKPLLTSIGGAATSPIAAGGAAEGGAGIFGGAGGLATGIGIGAFTGLLGHIIGGFGRPFGVDATTYAEMEKQVNDWVKSQNYPERSEIEPPNYVLSGDTTVWYDIPGYGKVAGYPSKGGAVLTDVGMYDPNTGKVFGSAPMVGLPTPQAENVSGGGGGGSSSSQADNGSLEPDPDLMGGTVPTPSVPQIRLPEGGAAIPPTDATAQPPAVTVGPSFPFPGSGQSTPATMPAPGPDGRPDPTAPPVAETVYGPKNNEEWLKVVVDWLKKNPDATQAEKTEAIDKYKVPAEVIKEAEDIIAKETSQTTPTQPQVVLNDPKIVVPTPPTPTPAPISSPMGSIDAPLLNPVITKVTPPPSPTPAPISSPGGSIAAPTPSPSVSPSPTPTPSPTPSPTPGPTPTPTPSTGTETGTDTGTGTGTGTGPGTGDGTGPGTGTGDGPGTGSGMFTGLNPRRTSQLLFPELYANDQQFTLVGNLLTYRPRGMFQ